MSSSSISSSSSSSVIPGIISPLWRGMLFERDPVPRANPPGDPPTPGPLKTLRLRLAKTGTPGEPGMAAGANAFLASDDGKVGSVPRPVGGGRRETRIPDGKEPVVGVEGRT